MVIVLDDINATFVAILMIASLVLIGAYVWFAIRQK